MNFPCATFHRLARQRQPGLPVRLPLGRCAAPPATDPSPEEEIGAWREPACLSWNRESIFTSRHMAESA